MKRYGFQLDQTVVPGCEKFRFGTDPYWECAVRRQTGPENHQGGSCKMGPPTDPLAVVNPLLQVLINTNFVELNKFLSANCFLHTTATLILKIIIIITELKKL